MKRIINTLKYVKEQFMKGFWEGYYGQVNKGERK